MAMKMNRMLIVAVAGMGAAGWGMAAHADAKAKFAADCAECHEAGDFEGEDAKALADTIKKIAGGQMKHKSAIKLSDAEITEIAGYMAKGGK
jgi:mono/diheme cytochrome c family protein